MGRIRCGGFLIEWWMGDHSPKHIHIYKDGRLIAKVQVPGLPLLKGSMNKKLRKILVELIQEERA